MLDHTLGCHVAQVQRVMNATNAQEAPVNPCLKRMALPVFIPRGLAIEIKLNHLTIDQPKRQLGLLAWCMMVLDPANILPSHPVWLQLGGMMTGDKIDMRLSNRHSPANRTSAAPKLCWAIRLQGQINGIGGGFVVWHGAIQQAKAHSVVE